MEASPQDNAATEASPQTLHTDLHVRYIQALDTHKDTLDYHLTEHLRISGVYWGLTALHLLGHPDALPRDETIAFVLSCLHPNGGFGAAPNHDPHILYTTSAVQILATVDALDSIDRDLVAGWIAGLQQPNGVFAGDEWGETDTVRTPSTLFSPDGLIQMGSGSSSGR